MKGDLRATLRPYQEVGAAFLAHRYGSGAILADDMGLGKTLQAIAELCRLRREHKALRAVVVAPTSLLSNWRAELKRFAPHLKVETWAGPERWRRKGRARRAHVLLTTYGLLRRDLEWLSRDGAWDIAIIDEAQAIKNPGSSTRAAASRLPARSRIALSGTPVENRLEEFWSLLDWASPGTLPGPDAFGALWKAGVAPKAAIRATVLRRTKDVVASELPAKTEITRSLELDPEHRALYDSVREQMQREIVQKARTQGVDAVRMHALAGLTKLRQICCDGRLVDPELPGPSAKLREALELCRELQASKRKVLVFSQFTSLLRLLRSHLNSEGIRTEYLDGGTRRRDRCVARFQRMPHLTAFLISLKAGGAGLNLTEADTVLHLDPWWNPAVEDQATDRAHRIGQSRPVTVVRLAATNTVEDRIAQIKARKRSLASDVLDAVGENQAPTLALEDVERLFAA